MRLFLTLLVLNVLSLNYAQITGLSGSAISGTSSSLSWTDGGADPFGLITDYWIYMGSSLGAQNYANSGALGPGLSSFTVTGIFPTTGPGSVIYARLWHKHADYSGISVWRYTDTTFLSIPGPATPGTKPTILSPTPGGALPTGGFTLIWTPGAYSMFWIYLGTFAGSKNLFDTGQLASGTTSFAIPGVYSAGTIWVRLWYKSGSTWKYIQTSYTAAVPPTLVFDTPNPSSMTAGDPTLTVTATGSPAGGSMTFSIMSDTTGGSTVLTSGTTSGTIDFTPHATSGGTIDIVATYTATSGLIVSDTFTIDVTASTFITPFELSSLVGSNGFVINGEFAFDYSGWPMTAGDINGDGIEDVIIGAYSADPGGKSSAGKTYVVFGSLSAFPASIELSGLTGLNGFVVNGEFAGDKSGTSVSAGDLNGDGIDDVIIGASYADPGGRIDAGKTYVVFGSLSAFPASIELSGLTGPNGFVLNGELASDLAGVFVSAGDINGDSIDDVIIGAFWADPGGKSEAGKTYVVFGSTSAFPASIELSGLTGPNGFVLNGEFAFDYSGWPTSAGDINGDGIDDVITGAFGADPGGKSEAGKTYVVFGSTSAFPASIELSGLTGSNGFVLNGELASDFSGYTVSEGDINGDSIDDVIIGAYGADPSGRTDAGKTYVVFGSLSAFPASIELSGLTGSNGFILNGELAFDYSSFSVSEGDINGDGIEDMIIGAYGADPGGRSDAGKTYVVFGSLSAFPASIELSGLTGSNGFVVNGELAFDYSGAFVSAGDINGDGLDDVITGAFGADPGGRSSAGKTYVVTNAQ